MQEVIEILEKASKPLSRTEIALRLNEPPTKISFILNKLVRLEEVKVVEIDKGRALKEYNCCRRMCLYIIGEV